MSSSYTIHALNALDTPAVIGLYEEIEADIAKKSPEGSVSPLHPLCPILVDKQCDGKYGISVGIFYGGELIARASMRLTHDQYIPYPDQLLEAGMGQDNFATFESVFVHPHHRGQGLMGKLHHKLSEILIKDHPEICGITACVERHNLASFIGLTKLRYSVTGIYIDPADEAEVWGMHVLFGCAPRYENKDVYAVPFDTSFERFQGLIEQGKMVGVGFDRDKKELYLANNVTFVPDVSANSYVQKLVEAACLSL